MSTNGETNPGLAWPDSQTGHTDRPGRDRPRRRRVALWDRTKILAALTGAWIVMGWSVMASSPGFSLRVVLVYSLRANGWLLALAGLEAIRQVHYLICERSGSYNRFWERSVFGGFERWTRRMNDWNRFRVSRAIKVLFLLVVLDLVLAQFLDMHPAVALFELPVIVFQWLPTVLQLLFFMLMFVSQFILLFWFLSKGGVDVYMPEDVKTRFSDVWGQDNVLEKVKENLVYLEDPEKIEARGGHVPSGILLWGPPGTGKTLLAEAVAGETGKPFVFVEPGAFMNLFIGVGILKVKALFRKLRKLALRYGGVIVFFDEADALGNRGAAVGGGNWGGAGAQSSAWSSRAGCNGLSYLSSQTASLVMRSELDSHMDGGPSAGWKDRMIMGAGMGGGGMGTLQALLTELSGLKKPRGILNKHARRVLGMKPKPPPKYRILVMMATNMPQALDEALLRPGRLDRIYKVGYPSKSGRVRTYQGYLSKVRHDLTMDEVEKLATITPYATGASIKDLVNEALISATRDGRDWITWRDIIRAKLLKELGPPEDVEYIERERHAVAIHEACHAVAAYRVRKHLAIDIATIEKGSTYLGMVASIPLEEQFTQWRSEYESDIVVALASLAGERMFFEGDSSSGVTGDLNSATTVAMFMEGYWGMGNTIGSHGVFKRVVGQPVADTSRNIMESGLGRRIEQKLSELLERAMRLLQENRLEVLAVAHALETHKTLTGEDVAAIVEGRRGPLVDGRPYHSPEFLAVAEAYHARAVDAHNAHGKVELPLPVFNGRPDDVVGTRLDGRDQGTSPSTQ